MTDAQQVKPTKKLWLHMLTEGGRWTSAEAADFLCIDQWSARALLNAMVAAGSLKRFEPAEGSRANSFGVTSECRVPMGVTLAELAAIGILKEAA
jgi:hypothetical protein